MSSGAHEPLFPMRQPCPCGSGKRYKNCCDGIIDMDIDLITRVEDQHPGLIAGMIAGLDDDLARRQRKRQP